LRFNGCAKLTLETSNELRHIDLLVVVRVLNCDLIRQFLKLLLIFFHRATLFQRQELLHVLAVIVGAKLFLDCRHQHRLGGNLVTQRISLEPKSSVPIHMQSGGD
jgi:hypothetical protein